MPENGTVLLIESNDERRERLGEALEDAGYEVISCPGPTAPDYTCIGGREGYCPLVERAEVVVLDPWLAGDDAGFGTTADVLVELYADRGRTVILLGSTGWLDPYRGGHVVSLGDRPDAGEVVAAVRSAPEAEGFVLRDR
jgi:CheY-like chemotaxis protein